MYKLALWDVKWEINTAGPSPHENKRVEVFTKGCSKGLSDPCDGCFNSKLWDPTADILHNTKDVANKINEHAEYKYVSISGGEPFDQIEAVVDLCKRLKGYGFHILVYTHYKLENILSVDSFLRDDTLFLLNYIDILVDGQYEVINHMYDTKKVNGLHNSVGSTNQIIWDVNKYNQYKDEGVLFGYKGGDLSALSLTKNNNLVYHIKSNKIKSQRLSTEISRWRRHYA